MTGRAHDDATTHRALGRFGTVVTTMETARYAGLLRARVLRSRRRAKRPPSGIDAIVAAHAALEPGRAAVFTSDPDDLAALLEEHPRATVCPIR